MQVVGGTVVLPQFLLVEKIAAFSRRHASRDAEVDPHGPRFLADHGDSAVVRRYGGRCPCCAYAAGSTGAHGPDSVDFTFSPAVHGQGC